MAEGRITRGTTGVNRLRRVDRYLAALPELRRASDPLVVDLGFGATPTTTLELAERMRAVRPDVEVVGLEVDPERVARGAAAAMPGVSFGFGGFELPLPGGRRPAVVRALNVLRQYDEGEVGAAWRRMTDRLAPGGVLVEGTCDELGRVGSWVTLDAAGPRTLTLSLRLVGLDRPSIVAERLPKALIHRNVPGERVHALLAALDRAWDVQAGLSAFGARQRFIGAVRRLADEGVPVVGGAARWRLGELTVPWAAVAPLA
jgi:SAM-dependent methyltransferase